jgi:hypothetical protein
MAKRSAIERAAQWLADHGDAPPPAVAPRRRASRKHGRRAAARHNRKCNVCRHREREAIERDFLSWRSADQIADDYGIADHSSICRHAHATGLFDRRAATIRLALNPIIERAVTVEVTADSVVRAVELFAHLITDGQLINPPKHVIHHSAKPPMPPPNAFEHPASSVPPPEPNRQNPRVEPHATH